MLDVLSAETHSSEYMLHKYWSRKPHNILSAQLKAIFPEGKSTIKVLDPFCGSGVFLREASLLNFEAHGFDINPIAVLLSTVTTTPPKLEEFEKIINPILTEFKVLCDEAYASDLNNEVRYLIHETVVYCEKCKKDIPLSGSLNEGKRYLCKDCNSKLRFNLKSLKSTNIVDMEYKIQLLEYKKNIQTQQKLSDTSFYNNVSKYNITFPENKRILSYENMKTSDLFTKRNFSLLSWLADRIHDIKDTKIKQTALLLLTASVAQCSRLIAYRNNMSSGGPSWSVPGFWVPPKHLETNPYSHLSARYKKFVKGLEKLNNNPAEGKVKVFKQDSCTINLNIFHDYDLVFFDPPYGDSIPYLEFSMLWNSFLLQEINVNNDISVSDRLPRKESWDNYTSSIQTILEKINGLLRPKGKLLITFNNHDYKAWKSLLMSLQKNNFYCKSVIYQIPAVVSSKAQFSPESSYVGDIYSLFEKNEKNEFSYDVSALINDLKLCASSRENKISKALLMRTVFVSLLENNLSYNLIDHIDNIILEIFIKKDGYFHLINTFENKILLKDICLEVAKLELKKGPCLWNNLYETIAKKSIKIGIPDPGEVRLILNNILIVKNKICYLNIEKDARYSTLF